MNLQDIICAVEAILYLSTEPVKIEEICSALNINNKEGNRIVLRLVEKYNIEDRGLKILILDDCLQLGTREKFSEYIRTFFKMDRTVRLTQPALETLAIIAYNQPVTKQDIERIRGVKSESCTNTLMELNLIKELGRKNAPGRPTLFGISHKFFKEFGIKSVHELPSMDNIESDMGDTKEEQTSQIHG